MAQDREPADLLLFLSGVAWAVAGAVELALAQDGRRADFLLAPLVTCIGYMLVEQGYLSPLTSPGYADRLAVHRRLNREASERLLDTERALEVQDRLVAAGVLALGASHEYRNVLASLRAAADHGLGRPGARDKDRSLRLVLEHARAGEESATALLERLGREGRESLQRVPMRALLERLARTLRPVARHAGVRLAVECSEDLAVRARPGEIAQVLLNLARNALDGFARRGRGSGELLVRFVARSEGRQAIVEVLDNAGGVPAAQVPRLFQLGRSSRGSTGVGLYLARCLAERNGGSLGYRPVGRRQPLRARAAPVPSFDGTAAPARRAGRRAGSSAPSLEGGPGIGLYCPEMGLKILAVNPGSTSTKLAIYEDTTERWRTIVAHRSEDLARLPRLGDQLEYRRAAVREALTGVVTHGELAAVVGRGGLLKPLAGGVYEVNDRMKADLASCRYGNHASNMGALIADALAREAGVKAWIVDPVVVDELSPLARRSGLPDLPRRSIFHALNQKATARKAAAPARQALRGLHPDRGAPRRRHLGRAARGREGGGRRQCPGRRGAVRDRAGRHGARGRLDALRPLPAAPGRRPAGAADGPGRPRGVARHERLPGDRVRRVSVAGRSRRRGRPPVGGARVRGRHDHSGLDGRLCDELISAMCYASAKAITGLAAAVSGRVDAVVLTGGLARSERVVGEIRDRVAFLAPVLVYPGENELEALALGVLAVLRGEAVPRVYEG